MSPPESDAEGFTGRLDAAQRLELALDAGLVLGTWFWDVATDTFVTDSRFAQTFGLDPQACEHGLSANAVMTLIHPEDRARASAEIQEAVRQGGPYRCEYRILRASGDYRWVEARGRVDLGPTGGAGAFPGVLVDIHDRRVAEDRLARTSALLQSVMNTVPAVVYAKDLAGRMLIANGGTADLVGLPLADILGRTDAEFLRNPEEARAVMENDARVISTGETEVLDEKVSYPDGRTAYWHSVKAPLRDGDGKIMGVVGASIDVTARRTAETALAREEAWFRSLADSMPQLVWTSGDDGMVDYYNAHRDAYGGLREMPDGRVDWAPVIHPEDLDRTQQAWAQAVASRQPFTCEHRLQMRDGAWRWHVSRGNPVPDADGVIKWFGTATDIHSLKIIEQNLQAEAARRQLALNAGRLGDWTWNPATDRVQLSPRAQEIYGVAAAEYTLTELRRELRISDAPEIQQEMVRAVAENRLFESELEIRRPDGARRWVSAKALMPEGGEPALVGVLQDVTEARLGEERRALLINELNHRVKNTLAVVQGLARQTLRGDLPLDVARERLEARIAALSRAQSLLTTGDWQAADFRDLVRDEVAAHNVEGRIRIDGPSYQVSARLTLSFALALHELATNAVKYGSLSAPDGMVTVRWTIDAERMRMAFEWLESGGPRVHPPTHSGFGSRLLDRALSQDLRGAVAREFHPDGLRFRAELPLDSDA